MIGGLDWALVILLCWIGGSYFIAGGDLWLWKWIMIGTGIGLLIVGGFVGLMFTGSIMLVLLYVAIVLGGWLGAFILMHLP